MQMIFFIRAAVGRSKMNGRSDRSSFKFKDQMEEMVRHQGDCF